MSVMLAPTIDQKELSSVSQLVQAAQAGDRQAYGALYIRYEQTVFAIAMRRLKNYADSQELCQEVFLQAFQKIQQLRNPECFGGWLRSIAARMAINKIVRRHAVFSSDPEMMESLCSDSETPLKSALESEQRSQVHRGLAELREMDRKTLESFYFQGHSLIEMSREFQAPIGTIKRRLHVARQRFAKQVEKVCV